MLYSVPFTGVPGGSTADTFKTVAMIRAADTAGYRARLRKLTIGPADAAPADLNCTVALKRVDDVSAGGAGTLTAVTPIPLDSEARAAVCTAGHTATVEPTTYGIAVCQFGINRRMSAVLEWGPDDAPVIQRDQLLGLLVAPETDAPPYVTGSMVFEEF